MPTVQVMNQVKVVGNESKVEKHQLKPRLVRSRSSPSLLLKSFHIFREVQIRILNSLVLTDILLTFSVDVCMFIGKFKSYL